MGIILVCLVIKNVFGCDEFVSRLLGCLLLIYESLTLTLHDLLEVLNLEVRVRGKLCHFVFRPVINTYVDINLADGRQLGGLFHEELATLAFGIASLDRVVNLLYLSAFLALEHAGGCYKFDKINKRSLSK